MTLILCLSQTCCQRHKTAWVHSWGWSFRKLQEYLFLAMQMLHQAQNITLPWTLAWTLQPAKSHKILYGRSLNPQEPLELACSCSSSSMQAVEPHMCHHPGQSCRLPTTLAGLGNVMWAKSHKILYGRSMNLQEPLESADSCSFSSMQVVATCVTIQDSHVDCWPRLQECYVRICRVSWGSHARWMQANGV